jgi:two-component system, sensor histidine kinase
MREVASWIRRSPDSAAVARSARALADMVGNVASHGRTLRQTQSRVEELVNADRRKDEFLAMLGHELRSPLGAIKNAAALLRSEQGESFARRRAHALIERQLRLMTGLVDDLLDVSRIRNGHLYLQRQRTDLCAIVRNAIETLESEVNGRRQQLSIALAGKSIWLQADPRRLEQVFVNLLSNASRYTDAGGEIAVSTHVQGGHAVVRMQDSGIGIAPEALPHVFDLYRQADGANPRSRAGLGIGLALVRKIVELHGGEVSVVSAGPGQGSEFTVRLPCEHAAEGAT